jgi:hypothetical protein
MKELLREWKKYLREQVADPVEMPSEAGITVAPTGKEGERNYSTIGVQSLSSVIRLSSSAINRTLKKYLLANQKTLPLHVKGYIEYLTGRAIPFTEKDLHPESIDELKKYIYDIIHGNLIYKKNWGSSDIAFLRTYIENLNKIYHENGSFSMTNSLLQIPIIMGATVTGYGAVEGERAAGVSARLNQPIAGQVSTFLGQYRIYRNTGSIFLIDYYDFNSANQYLSNLKTDNEIMGISDILSDIVDLSVSTEAGDHPSFKTILYMIATILTASGYKGYPVNINTGLVYDQKLANSNIEKLDKIIRDLTLQSMPGKTHFSMPKNKSMIWKGKTNTPYKRITTQRDLENI